jgi:ligand-binding sensor domain-containing protein/signal transduction histidine kinase
MKDFKAVLLTVSLFIFDFLVNGQSIERFERITREDGLSNDNVTSIIQDRFGFMWYTTMDGLSRYDGFSFKNFSNDPLDYNSVLSGNITAIYEAKGGDLWIGTLNGLSKLNPKTLQFKHYLSIENVPNSLSNNHISQISEDKLGNLWIATSGGGLNYFKPETGDFIVYGHNTKNPGSISSNEVNVFEIEKNGNLWIGTNTNLDYFDIKTNTFTHYILGFESYDQTKQLSVNALHLDKDNLLWIGTSDGLFTFNSNQKKFNRFDHSFEDRLSISDGMINTVFEDSYGKIWVGTNKGLNEYLPDKKGFKAYYVDIHDPFSLNCNRITYLYEDRSNILWIGTRGGGVNKLDLKRKKFHNLQLFPGNLSAPPNPSISCISGDTAEVIWLGTDGEGVCRINIKNGQVEIAEQAKIGKNMLTDDQITSSVSWKGKVWFGTRTGGLNRVEMIKGKYQLKKYKKTVDSTGISNNQVNCLLRDRDGFLWIGTQDGLNKLIDTIRNGNEYFIHLKRDYSDSNSLSDNNISTIYQDHKGFIWIGTFSNGLNCLNPVTGKIVHFMIDMKNSSSIGSNSVNSIFEDHFGVLWICTSGGGLNMFNNDLQVFKRFLVKDGLASNEIMSVIEDHSGYLWIGTSKGLSKFDPINKEFVNFDITDGLITDAFNRSAAYQDASGRIYMGTSNGLVYFHPSEIKQNPHKPDLIVTKFSFLKNNEWFDESYFISKYDKGEKIELPYDKNIFSLEFAVMDFTNPTENQYQYKIEGLNNKWVNNGNKRLIMVTNLEPGDYIIKIKGSNNDGIFNDEEISLPITIKPPFWRTNGFVFIILSILVFIVVSIYSFLIKLNTNKILSIKNRELELANQRLIHSEKSLKELNDTKDKFFSIIAHDLRNPFNPLLALTELLDNDYKELDEKERISFIKEIRHGAKKLYDLLENLLNWALTQTQQIKFNKVELDLTEIIDNNLELLQINAEKKRISIVYNYEGDAMVMADENMLNCIIRNLLNNAIKFSDEGTLIEINLYDEGNLYKIEVKDHGHGISPENISNIFKGLSRTSINKVKGKGSGLGLILCKEFVEKNNGKIWVESEIDKGSSFFFTIEKL